MRGRRILSSAVWITITYICVLLGKNWVINDLCSGACSSGVRAPVTSDAPGVTKVLFLGYRRGGSSISSEIFDTDRRAIFWYEPLDAFYFSSTGYHGRKDQRVLMLDNETDFRPAEPWEHERIPQFFRRLYNCELSELPSEFLAHRFMKHTTAVSDYFSCYQHHTPDSITEDLDSCRDGLERLCGRSVETSLAANCRQSLSAAHAASKRHVTSGPHTRSHVTATVLEYLQDVGMADGDIARVQDDVVNYALCLGKIEEVIEQCLHTAQEACESKSLRTSKIVRATMDLVKSIIKEVPELKIIIFVRDPRAMAYSRSGRDKQPQNILNSCVRACRKLSVDMRAKREIDHLYPGAVQILRYEDFVEAPEYWAELMYRHVGYTSPPDLDAFIQSHMFAAEDDGKKWGNIRTNATEIASRWRTLVSNDLMKEMQDICGGLIEELGYQIY